MVYTMSYGLIKLSNLLTVSKMITYIALLV